MGLRFLLEASLGGSPKAFRGHCSGQNPMESPGCPLLWGSSRAMPPSHKWSCHACHQSPSLGHNMGPCASTDPIKANRLNQWRFIRGP